MVTQTASLGNVLPGPSSETGFEASAAVYECGLAWFVVLVQV